MTSWFSWKDNVVELMRQEYQIMVEISGCVIYNVLNKEADTIAHTYPFPAK